jgi:hypothetical protein
MPQPEDIYMKILTAWGVVLLCFCGLMTPSVGRAAPAYQIGVYYYPGWSPYINWAKDKDSWAGVKKFPEREPSLGWYHDDLVKTLDQQLTWMADSGISFTIFDWYWENAKPAKQTSVKAYLQSERRHRVKYALLWANHTQEPRTLAEWDALSDFWIQSHLKNPEYQKIEGKPVIFVFSPDIFNKQASAMGWTVARLLNRARNKARAAGLSGIYFVVCVSANEFWISDFAPKSGFDAMSAYNYHGGVDSDGSKEKPFSTSFEELDRGYRHQWEWILGRATLPYFPAVTSGWDKRAWGGSENPAHDNSVSTPQSFEAHLRAAKAVIDKNPEKTKRTVVVCCWNEFGEGSYIEPTKLYGTQYIDRLRKVFSEK